MATAQIIELPGFSKSAVSAHPTAGLGLGELIEWHRKIFAEVDRVCEKADPTDQSYDASFVPYFEALAEAEANVKGAVIGYPVSTLAEFRIKAEYLLNPAASLWQWLDEEDCRLLLESAA
ncbi:hypothetical protein [Mesorhizobium sp.]|uniref:hypothetical protein n=1 Tax=Mesorhizobium sp. TaxID=1871066 RepID=UPI000FE95E85|nr:hypothetical protein [Mesorhizobium sp.]RWD70881.1 MAG: hypothetical protein EOS37_13265 [Mesorhizobium sp.]